MVPCCSHIQGSGPEPGKDGRKECAAADDLRPPQPASANASSSHTALTINTAAKTFIASLPLLGEPVLGTRLRVRTGDGGHDTRRYPSLLVLGHDLTEIVLAQEPVRAHRLEDEAPRTTVFLEGRDLVQREQVDRRRAALRTRRTALNGIRH